MPFTPFMPVQIFIRAAKMKEDIFLFVQNYQKWIKNYFFSIYANIL